MNRVLAEFYKQQPKLVAWYTKRMIKKHEKNPQVDYVQLIYTMNRQSFFALLQALLFLGFLASGFIYATTAYSPPPAVPTAMQSDAKTSG